MSNVFDEETFTLLVSIVNQFIMPVRSAYSLFLLLDVIEDGLVGRLLKARLVACLGIVFIATAEALWTEVECVSEGLVDAG